MRNDRERAFCITAAQMLEVRRRLVVDADRCRLPPRVVSRRVGVVELEPMVVIVSCEQERHAERAKTTELRVALLFVADLNNHLLNWNRFAVRVPLADVILRDVEAGLKDSRNVKGHDDHMTKALCKAESSVH